MAGRALATGGVARARHPTGGLSGTAGPAPGSPPRHPRAGAPEQPGAEARGRGAPHAGGGRLGASGGGVGRAILAARIAGHTAPHTVAEGAPGRRRANRQPWAPALAGRVQPPQRVVLTEWGVSSMA
jgi:hypothetical protein